MSQAGSALGCGVVRLIPEGSCMVEETLRIAEFFARESCGQCPACRMETSALAALLKKVQAGDGGEGILTQIPKVLEFNRGKGFCALINMPGPPLLSALRLYPEDFRHHIEKKSCPGSP
jgi:NADH:ubiquinone oxidoreductase subunit F (NADH-binding)